MIVSCGFSLLTCKNFTLSTLACGAELNGELVCKTFSAEVVYNVSATRNIGQGLQQFGISSLTTSVLIVSYGSAMKTTLNAVRAAITGFEIEDVSSGLSSILNKDRVRDAYDISPVEEQTSDLVQSIVTRIAVRDVR
jgi:hypothetical protein